MTLSVGARIGVVSAAVVGVAFGMARYAYGLTLPGIREDVGLSELVLGLISSATFVGYLVGLLLAGRLAARYGARAPTTAGGICGLLGAVIVALAQSPGLLVVGVVLAAPWFGLGTVFRHRDSCCARGPAAQGIGDHHHRDQRRALSAGRAGSACRTGLLALGLG
ncbi:MFS transporter [Nesterenkonia pannonica]|uniref:MFS transporter n=1 Tax=Nesterenkonia pannonica TaxID=1548602 RepID=UPI00216439EF|nr:MFS transporter [Nesterenkonia pannonica]